MSYIFTNSQTTYISSDIWIVWQNKIKLRPDVRFKEINTTTKTNVIECTYYVDSQKINKIGAFKLEDVFFLFLIIFLALKIFLFWHEIIVRFIIKRFWFLAVSYKIVLISVISSSKTIRRTWKCTLFLFRREIITALFIIKILISRGFLQNCSHFCN